MLRFGKVWLGGAGSGQAVAARRVTARYGRARQCRAWQLWQVETRHVALRRGKVWQAHKPTQIKKKKKMIYQPTKHYSWCVRNTSVSADVAGAVMEQLEREHGCVTKSNFLEASRPEDSPTHKLFEWDDTKAAEKYRLGQSRFYISNLRIVVEEIKADEKPISVQSFKSEDGKDIPVTTRAFVSVSDTQRGRAEYVNIERALSDEDMRKNVLRNALLELKEFEGKYSRYEELSGIFDAIDNFEEELEREVV